MLAQHGIIAECVDIAQDITALDVIVYKWEKVRPGQFANLSIEGLFLKRPLSIAEADEDKRTLSFIIQKTGNGTTKICDAPIGTQIEVFFPLGNGFQTPPKQNIWLVGGGVGVAPLIMLARELAANGCDLRSFTGFRDDAHRYGTQELQKYGAVNVSLGGLVTDPLQERLTKERPDVIMACGPVPMLAAVQKICLEQKITAYASLEARMGCGIGACLVCACKINVKDGFTYKRVCADGPVFDLSEVIFN